MDEKQLVQRLIAILLLGLMFLSGCRGYPSKDPPIHLNPNMDVQHKGKPYRSSNFFTDGVYMRDDIEGTIARGSLVTDEHLYYGLVNGEPARSLPKSLVVDENFMLRGQQVFNRTCSACHGQIGDGNGLVGRRLLVRPTSYHSDYMYNMPPGHYLQVIEKGIRTMPSHKKMIPNPRDKWAVVAYIRSLQMSQDRDGDWIKRSASWWKQ